MQFQLHNRWSGAVQFECGLGAEFDSESHRIQLGAAVQVAISRGADLSGAYLTPIRDDLWAVLSAAPTEVEGLRDALVNGRVNGSTYSGECACLVGTIANVRGVSYVNLGILQPNSSRPIERFFLSIKEGDTPQTSEPVKLAVEWIDDWLARIRATFGQLDSREGVALKAVQS